MAKVTDRIFGSSQKAELLKLGATSETEIEVLISNPRTGEKLVSFDGRDYKLQ